MVPDLINTTDATIKSASQALTHVAEDGRGHLLAEH